MNYKQEMVEYITKQLDSFNNEGKIQEYLAEMGLPNSLESVLSQNDISDYLWKRISEIQQKGGSLFLTSTISNVEKRREEISKKISDIELIIYVFFC